MKSERRHELQQNELADFLGRFIKKAEPYAPIALTAVIAVVIIVLGVGYFQSRAATQRSDATLLYLLNSGQGDPAALGDIAASYPDTQPARLAKLSQADAYLGQGIAAMFTDRELATTGLQDAIATYEEVFSTAEEQIVRSRAALGMARAYESLGEVEEAIEAYQQVIEIHESDAIVEVAEQRIDRLQHPDTQEFLAWFGEQKPEPADPSLPPDMPEAGGLPEMPDISIPDFSAAPATQEPATEEPAGEEPAGEEPAGEEPITEEPVGEEPVMEVPAEDDAAAPEDEPEPNDASDSDEVPAPEDEDQPAPADDASEAK